VWVVCVVVRGGVVGVCYVVDGTGARGGGGGGRPVTADSICRI
jgi:hypothetical protein